MLPTILCALPGFANAYMQYAEMLDDGVRLNAAIQVAERAAVAATYTEQEMWIYASILILLINKSFVSENHYTQFIKSRVSALKMQLKCKTMTPELVEAMYPKACAELIHTNMSYKPNLKRVIFQYVLHSPHPIVDHIQNLLKMSQMTVYHLITQFIGSDIKTALHFDRMVLRDLATYLKSEEQLRLKFGEGLEFSKLVDPECVLTNVSKTWQTLPGHTLLCMWTRVVH